MPAATHNAKKTSSDYAENSPLGWAHLERQSNYNEPNKNNDDHNIDFMCTEAEREADELVWKDSEIAKKGIEGESKCNVVTAQ